MSKRAREWSETFADYILGNSPGIAKNAGTRSALIDQWTPAGEIMAGIERAARRLDKAIERNDRLLKQIGEVLDASDAQMARLKALDDEAYGHFAAKADGTSRLVPFVPGEDEIAGRVTGLIRRNLNGFNGHNGNGHNGHHEGSM